MTRFGAVIRADNVRRLRDARTLVDHGVVRVVDLRFHSERADDPIHELPELLNRIDAWIAEGVIGGDELNVADFMVAPSLALILYRSDALPLFKGRPALDLVDRLLPEPTRA